MQWLYISTLTPRSTCLFLWSLKKDKKITLEIREQHGKLKLNVHRARKLILTTKPCKDTFGISIHGKWRLPYSRADISRKPVQQPDRVVILLLNEYTYKVGSTHTLLKNPIDLCDESLEGIVGGCFNWFSIKQKHICGKAATT